MVEINLFEVAAKKKLRFPYKGSITVEDLFDLNLQELDKIFKTLRQKQKASQEESLLAEKSDEDSLLDVQVDIVRYIVKEKKDAIETAKNAAETRARNQRIKEIIASKKDAELQGMSVEELEKMLQQ